MESWGGSTLMSKEKHQELFEKRLRLLRKTSRGSIQKESGIQGRAYNKKSRCKLHLPFVAGPGIEPGTS